MRATVPATARRNPYVGARAFGRGEVLYGREREAMKLADLLIAERVVLLHAPSGAGKTSLIQAAVVPRLEAEDFRVLPLMRVNAERPRLPGLPAGFNRYVFSALCSLEEELFAGSKRSPEELAGMRLSEYLKLLAAEDGRDQVIIFDQFEEIVTIDPTDWDGHHAFFRQVGAALTDHEHLRWALFSMREEFMGGLERYRRRIPAHLQVTFRLDFLDLPSAWRAVQQPAEEVGVKFPDAVAQALVKDLSMTYSRQPGKTRKRIPGRYVEPVHLQVVCHRLWSSLGPKASTINEIKPKYLQGFKDVDSALADYYADGVRTVAEETEVTERSLRDWFERELISEEGLRRLTTNGPEPGGMPPNRLCSASKVRASTSSAANDGSPLRTNWHMTDSSVLFARTTRPGETSTSAPFKGRPSGGARSSRTPCCW